MALKDEIAHLRSELSSLKTEVADLRRFQSWVMGIGAGIAALVAFFAEGIRKRLGF